MGILQQEYDRVGQDLFRTKVLKRIFKARNIDLTDDHLQSLKEALDHDQNDMILEIDGLPSEIEITPEETATVMDCLSTEFQDIANDTIASALKSLPKRILKSLYRDLPDALEHRRELDHVFRTRLNLRWGKGIDRLKMLLIMAQEGGEIFSKDFAERDLEQDDSIHDQTICDVLVSLQARGCRIASEIVCLLQGGYADGAMARWRSLHEVAVTGLFVVQHGGDVAERYLAHAAVERFKYAEQYQVHCHTLGYEPFTQAELDEAKSEMDALMHKYGNPFKKDYGWAANALKKSDPNFSAIEKSLDMSHWRPYFKMACQSVHSGSQALNFYLGRPTHAEDALLVGPSDAGFTDPGQLTALSLMMSSVALLTFRPNLDSLVVCECMHLLCDDIATAFFEIDSNT